MDTPGLFLVVMVVALLGLGFWMGSGIEGDSWARHCQKRGYHNDGQTRYICHPEEKK